MTGTSVISLIHIRTRVYDQVVNDRTLVSVQLERFKLKLKGETFYDYSNIK